LFLLIVGVGAHSDLYTPLTASGTATSTRAGAVPLVAKDKDEVSAGGGIVDLDGKDDGDSRDDDDILLQSGDLIPEY
jgi:hypothetical protein